MPYNDCAKQDTNKFYSDTFQYFIKSNLTYLQKDCIDKCIQINLLKICNCSLLDTDCNKCLEENLRNGSQMLQLEIIQKACLKECPIECDSISYILTPYYTGPLQDEKFLRRITQFKVQNKTLEEFKQNLVYISVYYSSLEYTKIEQIPKTELFDLISNIGGTLGLFIGVSFLSFIEFFELSYEVILFLIRK